jgi:DNA helicase-2/ATP-dependent DNA helicase PcrA
MTFKPSKYQQAIFNWIKTGSGNAIIEAVAGSGKTTTLLQAMGYIPSTSRVLFLAFNRSIAEELKEKVPSHCEAKTLNSLGHSAWYCSQGKVTLDKDKNWKLLDSELSREESKTHGMAIVRLVGLAKSYGIVPADVKGIQPGFLEDTYENWIEIIERFGLEIAIPSNLEELQEAAKKIGKVHKIFEIEVARKILKKSVEMLDIIDYDDQLYLPAIFGVKPFQYDWVFVDESQDLNPIQHKLVEMAVKPGTGRVVAVGDTNQAIYGFRGSDADSMANLKEKFKATSFPLSICYRCPKSHIALAKELIPEIEASDTAVDGTIKNYGLQWVAKTFTSKDLIICRLSAPLVKAAYKILQQKVAVRIMGRDIGVGLTALIKKLKANTIQNLEEKLYEWKEKEIASKLKKDPRANTELIEDKYETIMTFIEMFPRSSVYDLIQKIEGMYSNQTEGILTLSTVHKAKGLEAENVFVLNRELMPHKKAEQPWEMKQELNIEYIAYTRAKKHLGFIEMETKKPKN